MKSFGGLYDFGEFLGKTVLLDPWENDGVITPFSCCFCMLNDYVGGSEETAAVFYLSWDDTPSGDTVVLYCLICDSDDYLVLRSLTPYSWGQQQVVNITSLGCDTQGTPEIDLFAMCDNILEGINDVLDGTILTQDETLFENNFEFLGDMPVLYDIGEQLSNYEA